MLAAFLDRIIFVSIPLAINLTIYCDFVPLILQVFKPLFVVRVHTNTFAPLQIPAHAAFS